jgi:hypothetical protein
MIKLKDMISRSLFVEQKVLRVLDFDDTIVKTTSYIYITHANGKKSKLTPGEYAVYKPREGDDFDYSDFQSVNEPVEIKQMTTILRRMVKKVTSGGIFILTARAAYKPIKQYLKDIGIDTKKVYVVALASADPKHKAEWVSDKIDEEGFDDVYFADDSEKNVSVMNKMLRTKNVKFRTQLIKY